MKNKLKYKNKPTLLGKLKGFLSLIVDKNTFVPKEYVKTSFEVDEESYKYLYRNLYKINMALKDFMDISLTKTPLESGYSFIVVVNLKVEK